MLKCLKLFLALTSGLFSSLAIASVDPLVVIVDAGHGGKDRGATRGEMMEADLTLEISKKLRDLLRQDRRFTAVLTRETDEFIPLPDRVNSAQNLKGDIFVSIHANWSDDPRAMGTEIYFENQLPPDQESMRLAARENKLGRDEYGPVSVSEKQKSNLSPEVDLIIRDLLRNQRVYASSRLANITAEVWHSRHGTCKIRQAPFHVISNSSIPSVLIELGFLSHKKDAQKLADPQYRLEVAKTLHVALIRYHETLDKKASQRLQ